MTEWEEKVLKVATLYGHSSYRVELRSERGVANGLIQG